MVSCYSVFGEEASVKDPGMRQFIQKIGDYLLCRQPLNNKGALGRHIFTV